MQAKGQSEFIDAIFDPSLRDFSQVRDPKGALTKKRFDVYRNNIIHGLIEAVRDGFPMVERLVGEDFFREMARQFVRKNPPASPLMFLYGDVFPDFLMGYEPAQSVPYLADFARFEYQRRLAYFASDREYISQIDLSQLSEAALLDSKWEFHPSLQVMKSNFPIFGIYEKLESGEGSPRGAEEVLTFRRQNMVQSQLAPNGFTRFVSLLGVASVGEALEVLASEDATLDLSQLVSFMVQYGVSDA